MEIPKHYYNLSHVDIKTKKVKEDTGRICKHCGKPIYKIFMEEWVKKDGVLLSRTCEWNQWYTCCDECKKDWYEGANYIGTTERDERGNQIWKNVDVPGKLERKWYHGTLKRRGNGRKR